MEGALVVGFFWLAYTTWVAWTAEVKADMANLRINELERQVSDLAAPKKSD